jgi:hypothetical protein
LACLVGKDGAADVVDFCVDVLGFASSELSGVHLFEGSGFGFGGAYVLASLVEVSFGCLNRLRVVLLDVFGCQERPTHEVAGVDGFDPRGSYWVSTDGMHPLDGLFCGWEVIDAVGLAEGSACFRGWGPGLPLTAVLDEWYAVAAVFVADSYEEGFAVAGDEHIGFFVDGDSIFGEYGHGAIISGFSYTHEGRGKVLERVGS